MAYPEVKMVIITGVRKGHVHLLIRKRPGAMLIVEIVRSATTGHGPFVQAHSPALRMLSSPFVRKLAVV